MYTKDLKEENQFLAALILSTYRLKKDGDTISVCTCPKCHKGMVITKRTDDGRYSWRYDHYCNACGEVFHPSRIRTDIFFHTPYTIRNELETPFGPVSVKVNGRKVPFRFRLESYEDEEDNPDKPITIRLIDIDTSALKAGDQIFCGFEDALLKADDSDERTQLFSCENKEFLLGLCGYDPDDDDGSPYELYEIDDHGFRYHMISDPVLPGQSDLYEDTIIKLGVSWLKKSEYRNPDMVNFIALDALVG